MNAARYLRTHEVQAVLAELHRKKKRSISTWQNLIIFRLTTGAGLRVREISGLEIRDLVLRGAAPTLHVRKQWGKGKKARIVPLNWDAGALRDIQEWVQFRVECQGAQPTDRVIVAQRAGLLTPLNTTGLARRWKQAIECLGVERVQQLSIHCGRHTYASHAKHVGRNILAIRDALGHTNVGTTDRYLHGLDQDDVPDLYGG